jgi:hypothetical protein
MPKRAEPKASERTRKQTRAALKKELEAEADRKAVLETQKKKRKVPAAVLGEAPRQSA